MEVHQVAPRFLPQTGGIETAVLETSRRAQARGWDVTVHCLRHDPDLPDRDEVEGIAVRRYDPRVRLGYYTTRFRPEIPREAVVHLHAFAHRTNGWVLRHHDPARTLLTTHHGIRFPHNTPVDALYHALYRWWAVPRLARLHRVVTVNSRDRDEILARGVPEGKVEVVPNGVADEAFEAGDDLGEEGFVLYLGRLHPEKRAGDLLEALAGLDAPLVLAGPDEGDRPRLEARTAELGLGNRVRFEGRVPEARKRGLLCAARCLALPSEHEGQGIVLLEAWAQGTPVVAAATAGPRDLVAEGEDGFLVPVGDVDALRERLRVLLADPDLADRLGAAGREKAWERYRWGPLADRVVDLYEEILRRPGARGD